MDLIVRHLGSIHLSLRFLHLLGFSSYLQPQVFASLGFLSSVRPVTSASTFINTSSVPLGPTVKIREISQGLLRAAPAYMTLFEVELG